MVPLFSAESSYFQYQEGRGTIGGSPIRMVKADPTRVAFRVQGSVAGGSLHVGRSSALVLAQRFLTTAMGGKGIVLTYDTYGPWMQDEMWVYHQGVGLNFEWTEVLFRPTTMKPMTQIVGPYTTFNENRFTLTATAQEIAAGDPTRIALIFSLGVSGIAIVGTNAVGVQASQAITLNTSNTIFVATFAQFGSLVQAPWYGRFSVSGNVTVIEVLYRPLISDDENVLEGY